MIQFKVRDADGNVIGQFESDKEPHCPDDWEGEWNVEEADELNDEPVEWWNESEDQ